MKHGEPLNPTLWVQGLSEMADACDGFVIDQFGVLHNGRTAYPGAADAMRALRARGKRVIVLSNSGKRADVNAARLARFGATPDAYDLVLTSGELTWQLLRDRHRAPFDRFGSKVLLVNSAEDRAMIDGLPLEPVTRPDEADFVLLASLADDQSPQRLRPLFETAATRRLPMVCANPDRFRLTAAGIAPSSGTLATLYEAMGGEVCWVGKPHGLIYDICRERFERWLPGRPLRLCAIGDSLEHDIGGGARAGFDTLFIAGGLHAEQFEQAGPEGREAELARLLAHPDAHDAPPPTWALPTLHW